MPSGKYALKDNVKIIENVTVKIDSLALKSIKLILCIMILEQALGVGDGQGSLACCSLWGHKELDTT